MIEPTPTATPTPATNRLRGPGALRVLVVGVASIALAVSAAVALSAAKAPDLTPASAVGPGPADTNGFIGLNATDPTGGQAGPGGAGMRGSPGGQQFHSITLTGKNGNSLSLKTQDGWTRTITVDGDTTYTRAGAAITLNDLNTGDTIAFRQTKNADGSFKINEIRVILPQVGGEVTAVDGGSITLKLRDGSSKTITVNGSTRYTSGHAAATAADVKVGATIGAEGTTSGDTFTALSVQIRAAGAPNGAPNAAPKGPNGANGMHGRGGSGGGPSKGMPGPGGQHGPGTGPRPSAGTAG